MSLSTVERIYVCDDHPICTHGLETILKSRIGERVEVESFHRVNTLLAEIQRDDQTPPDFIFLDLKMPERSGLDLLNEFRSKPLLSKIIIMTALDQPAVLRQLLAYGLHAILSKSASPELIEQALQKHAMTFVDPELQPLMSEKSGSPLTPREFQVAEALAKGHTNREISELFGCSPETIKSHRASIMRKLGMDNRAELVAWFQRATN